MKLIIGAFSASNDFLLLFPCHIQLYAFHYACSRGSITHSWQILCEFIMDMTKSFCFQTKKVPLERGACRCARNRNLKGRRKSGGF